MKSDTILAFGATLIGRQAAGSCHSFPLRLSRGDNNNNQLMVVLLLLLLLILLLGTGATIALVQFPRN